MPKSMKSFLLNFFKKAYYIVAKTPLTKIPGAWNLSHLVFKAIWGGKNIADVQGNKFYINLDDPDPAMRKTFQAYAMNRVHEETTTNLFKRVVKAGDTVVDLGANIGYFTLLAAQLVGPNGKVFAFEPEPKNFNYLKKNVEINNYKNVFAFQKAASDKNGKIKLYICGYDSGHHTINKPDGIENYRHGRSGETKEIEIEAVSLDGFLKDKTDKVDLIKIDVEGAEALAINGMDEILRKNAGIKIMLEFFPLLIKSMGNSPEELIKKLIEDYGFNIFAVGHDYSMEKEKEELLKINSCEELMGLIKTREDHINLFINKGSAPS